MQGVGFDAVVGLLDTRVGVVQRADADLLAGETQAGAEAIMIGANTMHLVADQVQAAVSVPLIHIADSTADAVKAYQKDQGLKADGIAAKKTLEALYADVLNTETAE